MAWYEASAHFHKDYYKRRKLGGLLGRTTKSVRINLTVFQIGFILQFKGLVHTLKKFAAACLYTSNLLPTPMTWVEIWGRFPDFSLYSGLFLHSDQVHSAVSSVCLTRVDVAKR